MTTIANILVFIVGLEAFFILGLEMFGSQTAFAAKAFGVPLELLQQPKVRTLMANQGLYNGFIGVLIFFAMFGLSGAASSAMLLLLTGLVVVAAIFGAVTASKTILWVQGLPALLAFVALWFA